MSTGEEVTFWIALAIIAAATIILIWERVRQKSTALGFVAAITDIFCVLIILMIVVGTI